MDCRIESHFLEADGDFPNNPRLPLLVYRGVAPLGGENQAAKFERMLAENGWSGAWRNGVYAFHHYHSNAHEFLGLANGEAELQFGGPHGPVVRVQTGDVAILPAGSVHKRIEASPDLLIVGAYPAGQAGCDLVRDGERSAEWAIQRIMATGLPKTDPLFGVGGPLLERWNRAANSGSQGRP